MSSPRRAATRCKPPIEPADRWPKARVLQLFDQLLQQSREPSTRAGWRSAGKQWLLFTDQMDLDIVPTAHSLATFAAFLHGRNYAFRSISTYLSSVGQECLDRGTLQTAEWQAIRSSRLVHRIMDGIAKTQRKQGRFEQRATPLPLKDLERGLAQPPLGHDGRLFCAILTIGFFGLFRLGELVDPDDVSKRDPAKRLHRTDISLLTREGDIAPLLSLTFAIGISLRYAKTDNLWEGFPVVIRPLARMAPAVFHCVRDYLLSRDLRFKDRQEAFIREDGSIPTRSWFLGLMDQILGPGFSGHSLRSGGATQLKLEGKSEEYIRLAGRWKGATSRIYAREFGGLGWRLQIEKVLAEDQAQR